MPQRTASWSRSAVLVAVCLAAGSRATAQNFTQTQQRGVDYLLTQQDNGVFTQEGEPHVGVTALALGAVLTKPASKRSEREAEFARRASDFLLAQQKEDGSFSEELANYQTSAAVLALAGLEGDRAKDALSRAQHFLLASQDIEAAGFTSEEQSYGSFGYNPGGRGDLSNTQFAVEALRATGLDQDHDAFAKAIVFLQRTQNLRSVNSFHTEVAESGSDQTFPVEAGNDGGASYYPGNSKFGFDIVADGVRVPRSYGSMTYALLKTYAMCGLDPDDERMKAATDWIRRNWTLEVNPGTHAGLEEDAPYQGLFYYYHTMARALKTCGVETVDVLADRPMRVAWRQKLADHLAGIQRDDGSWLNEQNGRWWEDQPTMCTIYALLALADCQSGAGR